MPQWVAQGHPSQEQQTADYSSHDSSWAEPEALTGSLAWSALPGSEGSDCWAVESLAWNVVAGQGEMRLSRRLCAAAAAAAAAAAVAAVTVDAGVVVAAAAVAAAARLLLHAPAQYQANVGRHISR